MEIFEQIYFFIYTAIDFALHVHHFLPALFEEYGRWIILLLFIIIFLETGLVITPFLPGDSLLFVAGAMFASSDENILLIAIFLFIAAVIGDTLNYHIGKYFGNKMLTGYFAKFINPKIIEKTHQYFEKHGGRTIIIARFVPLVRTGAPFVAGVGNMPYKHFLTYNVVGGFIWIFLLLFAGYFFGNIPLIKNNLSLVTMIIILISILPIIWEGLKHYLDKRKSKKK